MPPTIQELEDFFKGRDLPKTIVINISTRIIDVPLFVDSHLSTVKAAGITPTFSSFYTRLVELKELLEKQPA